MTSRLGRVAAFVLAFGLGLHSVASAQAPSMDELSARLDPQIAATVRALIESAAPEGIPGEPLLSKALEGQSKGASGERIVLAVRNLAADLGVARRALGAGAASSEVVAGAGALRTGAPTELLTRLKAARGSHSLLIPLATLTDMVARGVSIEAAVETVLGLAERGASDADYRAHAANRGAPRDNPAAGAGAPVTPAPGPTVLRPPAGVAAPVTLPPAERPINLPR